MNTDVTIIIPTHFRHGYLARALEQYADTDVPIIVADSSEQPYDTTNLPSNFTYYHWPEKGLIEKLLTAVQSVETPLMSMRADNRHILPSALEQCAQFLTKNPDYAYCHGAYISVRRHKDSLYADPCYNEDDHLGVTGDNASDRTLEVWNKYVPAFYAVSRTDIWKRTLNIAAEGVSNFNALEVLNTLMMTIGGKSKRLPVFYCANQIVERVHGKNKTYDGFDIFATDEKYAKELTFFRQEAGSFLAETEDISQEKAIETIDASIAHHLAKCCVHRPRRTFIQKLPKYFKRAISIFDTNKDARFLAERKAIMDAYLSPLNKEAAADYAELMDWLDDWKDEI